MDLRQLRYFLAVVEHGSFTRAAAATGRTQQALSKASRPWSSNWARACSSAAPARCG